MSAAPAPPAAAPVPASAPPLTAAQAAELAATGGVWFTHPQTGAAVRFAPAPARAEPELDLDDPAIWAGYRSSTTLKEDVDAAIAELDAGLGMTMDEFKAEMAKRRAAREAPVAHERGE